MVGGVQRTSGGARNPCAHTQFRFGTSYESGGKIQKLRKHSIETHFPEDRNCDVCLRTKITRNPCRRGTGEASITEAEKFGDLITADHKVLNEGRWISEQSPIRCRGARSCHSLDSVFSVPNKTSQETEKSLRKFLEPSQKPKAICTHNSSEFGTSGEEFSWNRRTSTPHRSETNGIAERAVQRVKEGTAVQSGLDEKWWADSMECYCHLRNVQVPFGAMVE